MNLGMYALVLLAALIDSLQHFLIKSGGDPVQRSLSVAMIGGVLALPLLLITGMPDRVSWPLLSVSVLFGSLYWFALGWAYQSDALAVVFPLSRGAGILLTALGGSFILHDHLTPSQGCMLALILGGLTLITFNPHGLHRQTLLPSLCLAVVIAGFTLMDAAGVRMSGAPLAYCFALYVGNGIVVGAVTLPRTGLLAAVTDWRQVGPAALMSLTVYGMILYALAHGPVAVVAALAETSIIFTALIGILWLRERTTQRHRIGLGLIATGVILLRLDILAMPPGLVAQAGDTGVNPRETQASSSSPERQPPTATGWSAPAPTDPTPHPRSAPARARSNTAQNPAAPRWYHHDGPANPAHDQP